MDEAIYWLGFAGAWFLFAGPLYQASVELAAEDEARERMQQAQDAAEARLPTVSNWWWLLPPMRLLLTSRRRNEQKVQLMQHLSPEDLELMRNYISIARGWMFVAGGALLIFLKETWELAEHREWSHLTYWLLVAIMVVLALGAVSGNAGRENRRERPRRPQRENTRRAFPPR